MSSFYNAMIRKKLMAASDALKSLSEQTANNEYLALAEQLLAVAETFGPEDLRSAHS
jgi:acyl-CoA-binding protein